MCKLRALSGSLFAYLMPGQPSARCWPGQGSGTPGVVQTEWLRLGVPLCMSHAATAFSIVVARPWVR